MRRTRNASGADCTERHKSRHAASLQDTGSWSVYAHRSRRYKDTECGGVQVQRVVEQLEAVQIYSLNSRLPRFHFSVKARVFNVFPAITTRGITWPF